MSDLRGRWRNGQGVVLRVTRPFTGEIGGIQSLGHIWIAQAVGDPYGPQRWLVTEHNLAAAGYEQIGDNDE